jgi:hypothetical protein
MSALANRVKKLDEFLANWPNLKLPGLAAWMNEGKAAVSPPAKNCPTVDRSVLNH